MWHRPLRRKPNALGRCLRLLELGALTLLLGICMPTLASAVDWHYRLRPGDTLWDLADAFLKPGIDWRQLQDSNHIADPYHLPPGMDLKIPVAWLRIEPVKARVISLQGQASASSESAPSTPVTLGASYGIGVILHTTHDASLTLELADGSRVLMQGDSDLQLDRLSAYGRTGMVDTRLRLQRGRISNDVIPASGVASHFSVQTPSAISSVRGTHFRVATDASGTLSQTELLQGRVAVRGHGRSITLMPGQGTQVKAGTTAGSAQPLLSAPALDCRSLAGGRFPAVLSWPALHGAMHYRIEVADDMTLSALLFTKVIEQPQIQLPSLPAGNHRLNLRGIDAQGLEGADAVCLLQVNAQPQPPFVVAPQHGGIVRESRLRLRWTASEQAISYDLELATDAQFTQLLLQRQAIDQDNYRLPQSLSEGAYFWRIAARDSAGHQGPWSAPINFERRAEPSAPQAEEARLQRDRLTVSWSDAGPGKHYQVQLSRDADFRAPLLDRQVEQPQLSVPRPGSGTWYLRVRTLDSDGYAGPYGAVQRIKVPCVLCRVAAGGGLLLLLAL